MCLTFIICHVVIDLYVFEGSMEDWGIPNGSPSLNKEVTYLLTLLNKIL